MLDEGLNMDESTETQLTILPYYPVIIHIVTEVCDQGRFRIHIFS